MRTEKTKTRKLWSWDQIHTIDVNVRYHAQVYGRARAAMLRLGMSDEELQRYQTLWKEHLKVTTAQNRSLLKGSEGHIFGMVLDHRCEEGYRSCR
jgi:hypothetical protein